jgi:hypothetical protein
MRFEVMEKTLFVGYSEIEKLFGPPTQAVSDMGHKDWCYWMLAGGQSTNDFGYDNGTCKIKIESYLSDVSYEHHTEWRLIGHYVTEDELFRIIKDVYVNKKASELVKIINDYEAMSGE